MNISEKLFLLEKEYVSLHQQLQLQKIKNEELKSELAVMKGDIEELEQVIEHLKKKVIALKKQPEGIKALERFVSLKRDEETPFKILDAKDMTIPEMKGEYDNI